MTYAKTSKIEEELRRCTEELELCRIDGSSDLKGLESELFGGLKGQKKRHVGVIMSGHARDSTFRSAYAVKGDTPLVLDDLNDVHSCLSGGLYREVRISDTRIYKDVKSMKFNEKEYKVVAHWAINRKGSRKVCSISLFDSSDVFLAYVFTTNDPLAFDNFNCYRGEASIAGKPLLECVEQLVFCNNKVQLAREYLNSLASEAEVEKALTPINYHLKFWVKILDNPDLRDEVHKLEIQRPTDKNDDNYKTDSKKIDQQQLSLLLEHYKHYGYRFYRSKYEQYLDETEKYGHDLIPGDFYKTAGRSVIIPEEYVKLWESISMPCVIGARLKQLRRSAHERKLTAAMIPKCVIECSEFDHIWAWLRPRGVSMEDLIDSKFNLLIEKVTEVIDYQHKFIHDINSAGSHEKIADILFDKNNKEKLGLSEKFIQSLWTGEIKLPGRNADLQKAIGSRLSKYGISFDLYNPILEESGFSSYSVAEAIGSLASPAALHKS
jgi:hypothetical protein